MNAVSSGQNLPRWQIYALYGVIGVLTITFLGAGGMKLAGTEIMRANFMSYGYPIWFMYLIGIIEVAGAALLWRRQTRLLGALVLMVIMTGAVVTLLVNQKAAMTGPALTMLVLSSIVAWTNRPGRAE